MFKKKKEVLDLRPRDSDMPIPQKIKDRLIAGKIPIAGSDLGMVGFNSNSPSNISTENNSQSSTASDSSGGFFGFFGGNDSSNSPSSSQGSSQPIGNISSGDLEKTDSKVNDLLYRFSRLLDRVELVEKKLDRLERKDGSYLG